MKLRVDFSKLYDAIKPLGRVETNFSIQGKLDGIKFLQGIPIGGGKDNVDLTKIDGTQGFLSCDGHQVMVYIPDQGSNIAAVIQDGKISNAKRAHVAECKTIIEMRETGRFNARYDVISRIDGSFPVFGYEYYTNNKTEGEANLAVCQNCLKLLNYKNFQELYGNTKTEIVRNFSFATFFETYSSHFKSLPKSAVSTQSSTYVNDWASISSKLRNELNYTCEYCDVNLSKNPNLLHVHHINGNKADNLRQNLRALCADCHKKQPHHGHLYVPHSDILTINQRRREQNKIQQLDYDDIISKADSALTGLLSKCKSSRVPIPELGISVNINGNEFLLDLCWSKQKVAVMINQTDSHKLLAANWKVFSPFRALDKFDEFQYVIR